MAEKAKAKAPKKAVAAPVEEIQAVPPRLKERYRSEVVPTLMRRFGYKNPLQVPRLLKVVINMGLGEAVSNVKVIDQAKEELAAIAGQRPIVTRAKRSEASFKLRKGMPIGLKVTLRRDRMYEFLDRLLSVALPRIRDFKGLSSHSFDGRGNYNLGIREQLIFPEVRYEKVDMIRGMDIAIETSARSDEEARVLLEHLDFPFKRS